MARREQLNAVAVELRRLKESGVNAVYLDDATEKLLEALQQAEPGEPGAERVPTAGEGETPAVRTEGATDQGASDPVAAPADKPAADLRTLMAEAENPARKREREARRSVDAPPAADAQPGIAPIPAPPEVGLPEGTKQERWNWLRERVLKCPVCREHVRPGKQIVFGIGNLDADVFFCGEAPGEEEEIQGEPFVGKAGQLLTKIIRAMGLKREDVYIGNIMNWRPETGQAFGNRPPQAQEMAFCLPYLRGQLEIVQPRVIVALGNTAVKGLIGDTGQSLGKLRGCWHAFEGTPLMITYHPSYLLRNNTNRTKRLVWEDMLAVMERTGLPISDRQREYFS